MKKIAIFFVSIGFLFLFPVLGHAALGDQYLHKGMRGPDIKVLQNLLQSQGYFHYPKATGYYGSVTTEAVKEFQKTHGLVVDGITGIQTIQAVKLLRTGLNGTSIKNLQEQLKKLDYYHFQVTGIYGSITAHAVRAFQKAYGLQVDGVAGPRTLRVLHQYAGSPLSENGDQTQTFNVVSTAYTAYCDRCSGMTKSGVDLRKYASAKVVAVDPSIIPLGSKVEVPGYGVARAVDIGSAIKGKEIDVFIPDLARALDWGRKNIQVKVIK